MPTTVELQVLAPAPSPAHSLGDPDRCAEARRLGCRAYDRCLTVAADRGWRGFHCRACDAYVPQTPGERYRDLIGLLELLADSQLVAGLADASPPAPPARAVTFLFDADDTMPLSIPLAG